MKITDLLTDDVILQEIGSRLAGRRVDFDLTQASVARESGMSKRTVERIEAGSTAQTSSIIRLFRVLDLLKDLDNLIPETAARPMELLKMKGKKRQRASSRHRENRSDEGWSWSDNT